MSAQVHTAGSWWSRDYSGFCLRQDSSPPLSPWSDSRQLGQEAYPSSGGVRPLAGGMLEVSPEGASELIIA